jgi:hypothetical protein
MTTYTVECSECGIEISSDKKPKVYSEGWTRIRYNDGLPSGECPTEDIAKYTAGCNVVIGGSYTRKYWKCPLCSKHNRLD